MMFKLAQSVDFGLARLAGSESKLSAVSQREAMPPSDLYLDPSSAVSDLILTLLQKDRNERPQSATVVGRTPEDRHIPRKTFHSALRIRVASEPRVDLSQTADGLALFVRRHFAATVRPHSTRHQPCDASALHWPRRVPTGLPQIGGELSIALASVVAVAIQTRVMPCTGCPKIRPMPALRNECSVGSNDPVRSAGTGGKVGPLGFRANTTHQHCDYKVTFHCLPFSV